MPVLVSRQVSSERMRLVDAMQRMEVGDQWQHRVGGAQRELQEAVLQLLGLEFVASQQYSPYLKICALIKV